MPVDRRKTVTEVVVFTLEDVPKEYSFLKSDAIATIVDGDIKEVRIHIGNECRYSTASDCVEWLTALAGLASGLLEELEKDFASSL